MTKALWKPQGQHADNRELASFMALKRCQDNWEFLPRCWASFMFQEGCLFTKRGDGDDRVFLSLGHKHRAAWGFRVEDEREGGYFRFSPPSNDMSAQNTRVRLREMVETHVGLHPSEQDTMMETEWMAIPTTVCILKALAFQFKHMFQRLNIFERQCSPKRDKKNCV